MVMVQPQNQMVAVLSCGHSTFTVIQHLCDLEPVIHLRYVVLYKHVYYGCPARQMRTLYFCPMVSSIFFLFFPRLISVIADRMSAILAHMVHGLSANLGCRSEMCCVQLAGNAGPKKSPKSCHLGTIAQLCWAISLQLRHVSKIGIKSLLNTNVSLTCPNNMVNFGPLVAEISLGVWGIPANFNGFRVLAALLHGTLVVCISQILRR